MYLAREPGEDGHALRGGACIALRTGAEGHHDDGRSDYQHAGDDLQAKFHTVLATVQHSVEEAHENAVLLSALDALLRKFLLGGFNHLLFHLLRPGLAAGALHKARGDDGAAECSEQADESSAYVPVAEHGDEHHETHSEGGAKVGERHQLVLLEIRRERTVLAERDDGRVVGQEGHDGTQGGNAGKVEKRLHQRTQHLLEQSDHAEFCHQLGQSSGEDGDTHQVEHGIQQQVVRRVHHGLEHVSSAHSGTEEPEHDYQYGQEDDRLYG